MSQAVKEKNIYADAFRDFAAHVREGEPEWVGRLREGAFARFEGLGFPSTDEEEWKYTNVAPVVRAALRPAQGSTKLESETVEPFVSAEARQSRLVFVDGVFRRELSSLEAIAEGCVAVDLAEALAAGKHAEALWEHLGRLSGEGSDAFSALNTAFVAGGAFVRVAKGVEPAAPLQLLFVSTAATETATFPRVLVVAERDSRLDLIETYVSTGGARYMTDAVVELFVGEGARVTHYKVQDESDAAFHVASTRAEISRDGSYDLMSVTLGARLSRHNIEVLLEGEGAACRVDGLYIVGDAQHADTHSLIDHRVPRCQSRQNYKGILDGRARAVFNGRVFVRENAHGTDAEQSNKNLLLSREARVDTKPQLEIYNDDVKCSHGATVGQLEEDELFYLLSRGLHPDLARNLLTYGFAEEIVEKIKFESIRAQLDGAILNRLHARLEA
jgi:Fe-S cluster assembly protein SufD